MKSSNYKRKNTEQNLPLLIQFTNNSQDQHIEWHHSLSEVINSLIANGLKLACFNEFPYQVYNCFPNLIESEKGKWVSEKYGDKIPLMYSIKAKKD